MYEIPAQEGSLNLSLITTEVLGASEDPLGSATRYGLRIGSKQAVGLDVFTTVTGAGRSSRMRNNGPTKAVVLAFVKETIWTYCPSSDHR